MSITSIASTGDISETSVRLVMWSSLFNLSFSIQFNEPLLNLTLYLSNTHSSNSILELKTHRNSLHNGLYSNTNNKRMDPITPRASPVTGHVGEMYLFPSFCPSMHCMHALHCTIVKKNEILTRIIAYIQVCLETALRGDPLSLFYRTANLRDEAFGRFWVGLSCTPPYLIISPRTTHDTNNYQHLQPNKGNNKLNKKRKNPKAPQS